MSVEKSNRAVLLATELSGASGRINGGVWASGVLLLSLPKDRQARDQGRTNVAQGADLCRARQRQRSFSRLV